MKTMKPSGRARADRERLEECRRACSRHPRGSPRLPSSHVLDIVDRNPIGDAIAMGLFGLAFVGFAIAFMVLADDSVDRPSLIVGVSVFVVVGLAFMVGGVSTARSMTRLRISDDTVHWEGRGLLSRRSFDEPLSSYLCVYPVSSLVGRPNHRMAMVFFAYLIHGSDPARNVGLLVRSLGELGIYLDKGGERARFEELARSLNLPLVTESEAGIVVRNVDELDVPLARLLAGGGHARDVAGTGGMGGAGGPDGPGRPFPTKRYRITRSGSGWLAERGYPGYLLPFAAFAALCVAFLRWGPGIEPAGPIALVFGAFACFMLAFSLTRARLELSAEAVEASYSIAGFSILRQRIPLAEVEEVVDGQDPKARARSLLIAADRATIAWAQRGRPEEIAWFRDEILGAIGRLGPGKDLQGGMPQDSPR